MKIKYLSFLTGVLMGCMAFISQPCLGETSQNYPDTARNALTGVVVRCFDGDTIKLKDRRVVRLAGIDAPELSHPDRPAQYYSRKSRKILENLVAGKTVTLSFPGVSTRDRYGRLVADVLLEDGQSVNGQMVSMGAAFFYPHQDLGPEFQESLRLLQAEAIHERRGMWKGLLAKEVARKQYIGNRASLRFFPASCAEAAHIRPRNRANFDNLMDAFLAGYAPARICPFWPSD